MSFRSTVLGDEALSELRAEVTEWQKQPFSVELHDALDRSKGRRRGGPVPRMLRVADVESVLTQAIESSQRQKWRVFLWLWYSGLLSEARSLLDSSPTLQHCFGVGRQYIPGFERPGSRGHGADPSSRIEESERAARCGLWGESVPARSLHRAVSRVAKEAQGSLVMRRLAVCVGGAGGPEKDRVAKAIHSMTGRGFFAVLGPEDEDPDRALEGALAGGTLYLRDCDHLQTSVRSSLYSIMSSGDQKDMLLIVDCPGSRSLGFYPGYRVAAADSFSGHLGRAIGSLNFLYLSDLRSRIADIPLLVNRALESLGADDLQDIRHHLALWLSEQITKSREMLDTYWVENAVCDACEAVLTNWSPTESKPTLASADPTHQDSPRRVAKENYVCRSVGKRWELTWDGHVERVRDTKGIRAIAYLLSLPNGKPPNGPVDVALAADIQTNAPSDPGNLSDPADIRQYRSELGEVEDALRQDDEGVLTFGDREREEMEKKKLDLVSELSRSTNNRGRPRRVNRQAQAVGKSIADALKQIENVHLKLYVHLKSAIKEPRGQAIRYEPAGSRPHWKVSM
jgi:hypothetical protein